MTKRVIRYKIANDEITPNAVMNGGVAGDSNATELEFDLGDAVVSVGDRIHIEAITGGGDFMASDYLTLADGKVTYPLPYELTASGGVATIHLVISSGSEDRVKYAFPAKVSFAESAAGDIGYNKYKSGLVGIADECLRMRTEAESVLHNTMDTSSAAAASAAAAKESAEAAAASAAGVAGSEICCNLMSAVTITKNGNIDGFVDFFYGGERHRYYVARSKSMPETDGEYILAIYKNMDVQEIVFLTGFEVDYIMFATVERKNNKFCNYAQYSDWSLGRQIAALSQRAEEIAAVAESAAVSSDVANEFAAVRGELAEGMLNLKKELLGKFSNSLTNTAVGSNIIGIDDLSPIYPTIALSADNGTADAAENVNISVYGRNLIDYREYQGISLLGMDKNVTYEELPGGGYKFTVSQTTVSECQIRFNPAANRVYFPAGRYHSYRISDKAYFFASIKAADGDGSYISGRARYVDVPKPFYVYYFSYYLEVGTPPGEYYIYPQFEMGDKASEYEPYQGKRNLLTNTVGSDYRVEIDGFTPATTIVAMNGSYEKVNLKAQYNQDLNIVIKNLKN